MDDDPTVQTRSIGYRRPPRGFRQGQSGNPAGRPKGARNKPKPQGEQLRSLMLEEAWRPVTISENGEEITLPMVQAVFRSLAEAAAKGEARSQAMFLKIVSESENEAAAYEQILDEAAPHTANGSSEPGLSTRIEFHIVDPPDPKPVER